MKQHRQFLPLAFTLTALSIFGGFFLATACLSNKAKPGVLFPPAQLTWPAVKEDLDRGLADGLADGDLNQPSVNVFNDQATALGKALKDKDIHAVQVTPWYSMEPWAERGIQDKLNDAEIGPGVAISLREQLTKFTETIEKIQAIK